MLKEFKDYLYARNILVQECSKTSLTPEESAWSCTALLGMYSINIIEGADLANQNIIRYVGKMIDGEISEPFYKGFPESVKKLSVEEKLINQLYSYYLTYGLGNFDDGATHAVIEDLPAKVALAANDEVPKNFSIMTEECADKRLHQIMQNLLDSTRPLATFDFNLLKKYIETKGFENLHFGKGVNTWIKLAVELNNPTILNTLKLNQFMKVVDYVNYTDLLNSCPSRSSMKNLRLSNQSRKFLTKALDDICEKCSDSVMDVCSTAVMEDITFCIEQRANWKGFLYHIHYKPKSCVGKTLVNMIHNETLISFLAVFEKWMSMGDSVAAAEYAVNTKGATFLLRHLNYIISRCKTEKEMEKVFNILGTSVKSIALMQLLLSYESKTCQDTKVSRNFVFTQHNLTKSHIETPQEVSKRKSILSQDTINKLTASLRATLKTIFEKHLTDKRIYVDPKMKNIAVPLYEGSSVKGLGTKTPGSIIDIPEGKIIRAFTYWEKVNDIDLSSLTINKDGTHSEYSWRTFSFCEDDSIVFSGDQTSGYSGGSEFIDIDLDKLKVERPNIKYLIMADTVYSGSRFDQCYCTAGFMMRNAQCSGEPYEPKTAASSFIIDCKSTQAYMYAIDVENRKIIWLNVAKASSSRVADSNEVEMLKKFINISDTLSVYDVVNMFGAKKATLEEIQSSPTENDIIISDDIGYTSIENAKVIHSADTDEIMKLIQG